MKTIALILAGGSGIRIKAAKVPKQFLSVNGKPIFIHCLELYDKIKEVDEICLAVNARFLKQAHAILKKYKIKKLKYVVPGGKVRQETIRNAFNKVDDAEFVVIQNAVSPTVTAKLVRSCIKSAQQHKVVSAFLPAFHTIIERKGGRIESVLNRRSLGYACDPQVFQSAALRDVLRQIRKNQKKDVPMLKASRQSGYPVHLVESENDNIKTTFLHDLKAIEFILKEKK